MATKNVTKEECVARLEEYVETAKLYLAENDLCIAKWIYKEAWFADHCTDFIKKSSDFYDLVEMDLYDIHKLYRRRKKIKIALKLEEFLLKLAKAIL